MKLLAIAKLEIYNGCIYLSMLALKLIHVSYSGPCCLLKHEGILFKANWNQIQFFTLCGRNPDHATKNWYMFNPNARMIES